MTTEEVIRLGRLNEISDEDILNELVSTAQASDYEQGAVIYKQGDKVDGSFCLVADGNLEVTVGGLRKVLGPGDVCGETAFLNTAQERTARVRVSSPTARLIRWTNFGAILDTPRFRPLKDLLRKLAVEHWVEATEDKLA